MEIRINKLTLHNFKGVRDASFPFDGQNARIEGENGAGKSTVFDAFTWLLFGKDHRGQDQTSFDIKPIDPVTREVIHGLEHWVEAELTVNGMVRTLRREWTENWVKPKGEVEKVLKGHISRFLVDGVDAGTKAAYDARIHEWVDEAVFKMITNPLHFIDDRYTDWKARRKALLALVGSTNDDLSVEFSDLLAEMRGDSIENFRKRIAAAKRDNKTQLSEARAKIIALTDALPAAEDVEELNREGQKIEAIYYAAIDEVKAKIGDIDAKISDRRKADADRVRDINAKNAQISTIRTRMGEILADAQKRAQNEKETRRKRCYELRDEIDRNNALVSEKERAIRRMLGEAEDATNARTELALELRTLGEDYRRKKDEAFDYSAATVCPTCGRPIPEESQAADRERHLEAFNAARRATLDAMTARAQKIKDEVRQFDAMVESRKVSVEAARKDIDELKKHLSTLILQEKALGSYAAVDMDAVELEARGTEEYRTLAAQEQELSAALLTLQGQALSVEDLLLDRRNLEKKRDDLLLGLSNETKPLAERRAAAKERARLQGIIADLEKRERYFADEVARLERTEFRVAEYVKASIDAQEGALNALFRVARWKMFERTMDGGLVEVCEVTDAKGVPYRSMNDAQKIRCGMDVIRVFSGAYDTLAPIFIDNAEGCTQERFDTTAQVVRLVVTKGAELTMIKE